MVKNPYYIQIYTYLQDLSVEKDSLNKTKVHAIKEKNGKFD